VVARHQRLHRVPAGRHPVQREGLALALELLRHLRQLVVLRLAAHLHILLPVALGLRRLAPLPRLEQRLHLRLGLGSQPLHVLGQIDLPQRQQRRFNLHCLEDPLVHRRLQHEVSWDVHRSRQVTFGQPP
jgi:hypothetical protein